jgi:hypothetical protein
VTLEDYFRKILGPDMGMLKGKTMRSKTGNPSRMIWWRFRGVD